MKMFGVLDLETQMEGCRFSIGIRNSHDKSLRLGLTAGLRVFVCSNMAFSGEFTPVLAKHTKSFNLIDTLAVGVDRIQRGLRTDATPGGRVAAGANHRRASEADPVRRVY